MAVDAGSFRPEPVPNPRSRAALHRDRGFDRRHDRFLETEQAAVTRLIGFYQQSREELEAFLKTGGPSASDRTFFAELRRQADLQVARLETGSTAWLEETLPAAYVTGSALETGETIAFRPVHDQALRALSSYTLGLIKETNEGVRRGIQQAIGSAIASGISRAELETRIIGTGLQPGPWKNVETRAGVIARTEVMRVYNAGNTATIREHGAVAGEWHTTMDERACPICAPRDGRAYILPGVTREEATAAGAPAEWRMLAGVGTGGIVEKIPPQHPRCRCTIRARYRDDSGAILTPKPPDDAATLAEAGAVAPVPAVVGPSDVDFAAGLKALTKPDPAQAAAAVAFWRSIDLTPERVASIVAIARADRDEAMENLLRYRHGVNGLEQLRASAPECRTDGGAEDFAESVILYALDPAKLRRYCPARYVFIRTHVFDGREA